jgi:parallel beta-helix repeat protein
LSKDRVARHNAVAAILHGAAVVRFLARLRELLVMPSPSTRSKPRLAAFASALAMSLLASGAGVRAGSLPQPECGGAVPCNCGDRVVEDYVMTADLGPCTWAGSPTPNELVGLRVDSDVTLDCAGHSILGPADGEKEEFGIRTGTATRPVANATIKNCTVSGFWWGFYVAYSSGVVVEDSTASGNGWFSEVENGTGYGIDVANSTGVTLRRNQVLANGNEGMHLTSSAGLVVEDNQVADNGWEQVYLIEVDDSTFARNDASGNRQSLEMRDSNDNQFSYNAWRASPRQWLEDFNDRNVFLYDSFEGKVEIDDASNQNRFELCSFWSPGGECAEVRAANNTFFKSHFTCKKSVDTSSPLTLDRVVSVRRPKSKKVIDFVFPECSADMDEDGDVGLDDEAVVAAALGSTPGGVTWNPEADLDHDGLVGPIDVAAAAAQLGACDFENSPPRAKIKRVVLADNPDGQPDLIRIDAAASSDDDDAIVRYEFAAESLLTGEELYRTSLTGVPAAQAHVDFAYPPGKHAVFVYVTDRFGVVSPPKRKILSVR